MNLPVFLVPRKNKPLGSIHEFFFELRRNLPSGPARQERSIFLRGISVVVISTNNNNHSFIWGHNKCEKTIQSAKWWGFSLSFMSLSKEQTTHNFEWFKPVSKWQALLLSFPIHVKRTESSCKSQSKKGNLHAHKRKNNYALHYERGLY